jgi:chemotaxis response regulator CheB
MSWVEHLTGLLDAVAEGRAGQAGRVLVTPPDDRVPVSLTAESGAVRVAQAARVENFSPGQGRAALSAYEAAVEGYA